MRTLRFLILVVIVATAVYFVALFVAGARRKARARACVDSMRVMQLAALDWADSHDGNFPTTFPIVDMPLHCPETSMPNAPPSTDRTTEYAGYKLVTPGLQRDDTNSVFIECLQHGYVVFADGRIMEKKSGTVVLKAMGAPTSH